MRRRTANFVAERTAVARGFVAELAGWRREQAMHLPLLQLHTNFAFAGGCTGGYHRTMLSLLLPL